MTCLPWIGHLFNELLSGWVHTHSYLSQLRCSAAEHFKEEATRGWRRDPTGVGLRDSRLSQPLLDSHLEGLERRQGKEGVRFREGGYLHAHLPNLSKPPLLLWFRVRSDSMRKSLTTRQGCPTSRGRPVTVCALFGCFSKGFSTLAYPGPRSAFLT